jgi:hypothetical protein
MAKSLVNVNADIPYPISILTHLYQQFPRRGTKASKLFTCYLSASTFYYLKSLSQNLLSVYTRWCQEAKSHEGGALIAIFDRV